MADEHASIDASAPRLESGTATTETSPDVGSAEKLDRLPQIRPVHTETQAASPVPSHSMTWAQYVRPYVWAGVSLFTLLVVAVFGIIAGIEGLDADTRLAAVQQWAGVVFPQVVAMVSASFGYLFGTRAAEPRDVRDTK